jgi:CSLREA domain-containing protein
MALRAVLAAALVCVVPSSAQAATIPVTTGTDGIAGDGLCTLREAISSANSDTAVGGCPAGSGADEVAIPALKVTLTANPAASDTIATGDLDLTGVVTVRGAGVAQTTVDGARKDRVFDVAAGATATVSNLTVTRGEVPAANPGASIFGEFGDSVFAGAGFPGQDGGGIRNRGTLTVTDAAIVDNRAGAGGPGGTAVGGDCSVPGVCNGTPGGDGDGGTGGPGGRGGGIASVGDPLPAVLTVRRTRVVGNQGGAGGRGGDGFGGAGDDALPGGQDGGDATGGGGGAGGAGGGIWAGGALTVSASTLADNRAGVGGRGGDATGGDAGDGGNNPSNGGTGGTAGSGPGGTGGAGGGVDAAAAATIEDSALSGNAAGPGGQSGNAFAGDGGNGVGTGKGGPGAIGAAGLGGAGGAGGAVRGSSLTLRRLLLGGNSTGSGGDGGNGTGGTPGTPLAFDSQGRVITGGGFGGDGGTSGSGGALSGAGTVADSTLHGNSTASGGHGGDGSVAPIFASNGGGGSVGSGGGASHAAGTLALNRVTVTANSLGAAGSPGTASGVPAGSSGAPGAGPALHHGGGQTILADSIVAESGASACSGSIDDGGNNFRFPASSCPGFTQDPQLGPLAGNGGATQTRALAPTSPAINRASCSGTDQRRVARPAGAQCDSGAYEFAPPVVSGDAAIGVTGTTATLRAGVNPNARPTTVRFEYGPTLALGSATAQTSVPVGVSAVTIAVPVLGLTPLTTYHFRAIATNGDGSTTGPDGSFTTGLPPQSGPTTDEFETAVTQELADVIAALRRLGTAALGRTGTFSFVATVPGGGVMAVTITAPNATLSTARTVLVGKARKTFSSAGSKRIRIKLTRKGRRLMQKTRRRVKLKVTTTFTPTGGRAIKRTKTFKLRRRSPRAHAGRSSAAAPWRDTDPAPPTTGPRQLARSCSCRHRERRVDLGLDVSA